MKPAALAIASTFVASAVQAAVIGPDGVNSVYVLPGGTVLNGSGVQIGQAELGRSSKAGFDSAMFSSPNTSPAAVYVQSHNGTAFMDEQLDLHATFVAQQMIGNGSTSGVSPRGSSTGIWPE
jgi:hypothetical protein